MAQRPMASMIGRQCMERTATLFAEYPIGRKRIWRIRMRLGSGLYVVGAGRRTARWCGAPTGTGTIPAGATTRDFASPGSFH